MSKDKPKGCLFAIFNLLGSGGASNGSVAASEALPYRRKDYLLTKAERAFFDVLQTAVGQQHLIFAMVRLADLVYIPKGTESWQRHFNRIQSKHIDFVLCDARSLRPLLAIELDDSSHNRADRQERDSFIDETLKAADLPLLRIKAKREYNAQELARSIHSVIQG